MNIKWRSYTGDVVSQSVIPKAEIFMGDDW